MAWRGFRGLMRGRRRKGLVFDERPTLACGARDILTLFHSNRADGNDCSLWRGAVVAPERSKCVLGMDGASRNLRVARVDGGRPRPPRSLPSTRLRRSVDPYPWGEMYQAGVSTTGRQVPMHQA